MKKLIASAVLAALTLGGTALFAEEGHAAPAGAVRLEAPKRHVEHVRVTYVQQARRGRVWVEFNTGSLWSLPTCKHEDSNNCYWAAGKRGNHQGRSSARLAGKTYYGR